MKKYKLINIKKKLTSAGMNDYAIEREVEKMFNKPEPLQHYESGEDSLFNDVTFYFSKEEYERFGKVFKVLNYVENNTNQNWILWNIFKDHHKLATLNTL
jgi:uncharacterized protein YjcR